jgi:hypothetical protein
MSFLYNKDLLEKLKKIAQTQNFDKESIELAKNLIPLLEQQIDGKDTFTANKADAELHTTNLKDLDSFLFFLYFNKITHNGTLIVYKGNVSSKASDKSYVPYLKNGQEPYEYYINKNSISAYLKSLLDTDNPVLKVMINKLIESLNQSLNLDLTKDTLSNPKPTSGQVGFAIEDNSTEKTQNNVEVTDANKNKQEVSIQQQSAQLFEELAKNLPLDNDDVDFQRIERFFQIYEELNNFRSILTPGRVSATTSISAARQAIKQAQSATVNGNTSNILLTGLTPQQLTLILKTPWNTHYDYFIEKLLLVIENTRAVISEFYNAYVRKSTPDSRIVMSDSLAQLVSNQMAIYTSNNHQLSDLKLRMGEIKV